MKILISRESCQKFVKVKLRNCHTVCYGIYFKNYHKNDDVLGCELSKAKLHDFFRELSFIELQPAVLFFYSLLRVRLRGLKIRIRMVVQDSETVLEIPEIPKEFMNF